jgi:hypothetical protein
MVINRSIFHLSCEIFHKCVNVCFSGKKEIRIVSKLEKQKSELVEVGEVKWVRGRLKLMWVEVMRKDMIIKIYGTWY